MGLKEIANSVGVKSEILYKGIIGHHENKAFINLLDIEMGQSKDLRPRIIRK